MKCIAFKISRERQEMWIPCPKEAEKRGKLCRQHRDTLDGVVMGFHATEIVEPRRSARAKRNMSPSTKP